MGYLFRYRPTDMKIKDYVCMYVSIME